MDYSYWEKQNMKGKFAEGEYKIEIPETKITLAVKIIDMLGEELLITKEI